MNPAQKHVPKDRNNAWLYLRTAVVPFRISDYKQKNGYDKKYERLLNTNNNTTAETATAPSNL